MPNCQPVELYKFRNEDYKDNIFFFPAAENIKSCKKCVKKCIAKLFYGSSSKFESSATSWIKDNIRKKEIIKCNPGSSQEGDKYSLAYGDSLKPKTKEQKELNQYRQIARSLESGQFINFL